MAFISWMIDHTIYESPVAFSSVSEIESSNLPQRITWERFTEGSYAYRTIGYMSWSRDVTLYIKEYLIHEYDNLC